MLNFTITKRKLSSFIALLAFLQVGLWYGGLADLIPVALLNQWNRLTLIFSVILAFLCIARKREINIATTLIVLFKVILILSTYINGRTVDEVEFTRFLCIVLSLEYFEDELDSIVTVLMLVCELMVYYNLVTLSVGPDLYGAYYTALGYDNAAPPYLMAAYLVAICFALEKRKYIRTIILIVAIHATLLITMVGTGLVAVFFVDILLIWNLIKSIELTLIKTYVINIIFTFLVVVCRIQNLFSFIIVDMLGKDLTFTGRTRDWDLAFELIPQRLLLGYGSMNQATEKIVLGDAFTHNGLLELVFRGGIIALFIFTMAIYFISKVERFVSEESKNKSRFLLCVLCGYWIMSVTEVVFEGVVFYCALMLYFHYMKFLSIREKI